MKSKIIIYWQYWIFVSLKDKLENNPVIPDLENIIIDLIKNNRTLKVFKISKRFHINE